MGRLVRSYVIILKFRIRLILISETFLIGLYLFAGYKILNKKFKMLAEASKK